MSYSPSEFLRDLPTLRSGSALSVFHLNARSLRKNFDEISMLLSETNYPFDTICFTETWLSSGDDCMLIDGYECISA